MANDYGFLSNNKPHGRCNKCEHCKVTGGSGGWSFLGCYCKPYTGKWVAEIKDCPIGKVGAEDGK